MLAIVLATGGQARDKLVLSGIERAPHSVMAAAILKAAYRKLDIEVEIYYTSGKRSLVMSSSGAVDGEVSRVRAVGESFSSLHRIELPLMPLETAVFVQQGNGHRWSFDDLPRLRVGYLNGVKKMETFTREFPDVWVGHSNDELFKMLIAGHLDAVVTSMVTGRVTIELLHADGIVVMDRLVDQEYIYHYLHEKNRDLVPRITAVLERMAESGQLDAISDAAMDELLSVGYPEIATR
ncbi:MAG: transporter substrate-binding domain-containing protein [Roseibium sp.]